MATRKSRRVVFLVKRSQTDLFCSLNYEFLSRIASSVLNPNPNFLLYNTRKGRNEDITNLSVPCIPHTLTNATETIKSFTNPSPKPSVLVVPI